MAEKKETYDMNDYKSLLRSNIPASLSDDAAMRFDSAEDASAFFARELDFVKAQTYDQLYPEFTALDNFPISHEVNPGAETVTYYSYENTGFANIINNYATDLPRADIKGTANVALVKSVGASYGYSIQEMRASRYAGKSLDTRKANSARHAIEATINAIAWRGDEENGLLGVLSENNNVPLYTLAAGASGSTDWKSKTPDEILTDITGMFEQVTKTTKNVERPDTLAVPADVYVDISMKQLPNTGLTVKTFLLANAPYLKNIISASELGADSVFTNPYAADDGTGKGVAFLFTNSADKFTLEEPLAFTQYPIQTTRLEVEVPCEARTAGVIFYYPLSALVVPGV